MAQDVSVMGADFYGVPTIVLPKVGGGMASFTDTSGTTATADRIYKGYGAFGADGTWMDGTGGLSPIMMRPDAEVVHTVTYDKHIVADEEKEIPTYKTTATVLIASANLTPTVSLDYEDYSYCVCERMLTIPEYNIDTKAKGRVEYSVAAATYEIVEIPANTINAISDPTKYLTSRSTTVYATGNCLRIVYWGSPTSLAVYASAAYGTYQTVAAPTISGSTLTLKTPAFGIRGHATYFTSTFMDALTDIRYQYVIEVWRAPKDNLGFDGWTVYGNGMKVFDCVKSDGHNLE